MKGNPMLIDWLVDAVYDLQQKKEDIVLATVLKKSGSAPCLAGAKMIVRADGRIIGSVGGGALEAGAIKAAGKAFTTRESAILSSNLSGADAASMQMICGGQVEVLVEYIPCSPGNIEVFRSLREALGKGEECYLMAAMGRGPAAKGRREVSRFVTIGDGSLVGEAGSAAEQIQFLKDSAFRSTYPVLVDTGQGLFFVERCFAPSTLYIFGAGHVSQKLATLAEIADFRVVVLDDREEFANRARFPEADEIVVLDSFADCRAGLEFDQDSYLVIVTRGHQHDATVLGQVLGSGARYVGMMGSRKKREELFRTFAQQGIGTAELDKVHCPVGLEINAETTVEIAFSIMAQLILARSQPPEELTTSRLSRC